MRIGLLLANSRFVPQLAADVRHWIAKGLAGADHRLVVEATPYNESPFQVRDKIQRLMVAEEADIVVAPLGAGMLPRVADLAAGQEVPLLVLTMGEDVCEGDTVPPWVFVNSLGLWRSAWLTGRMAGEGLGSRVCIVSAAHESGYGLNFAVALGVESAGGAVVATMPAPAVTDEAAVSELVERAAALAPDGIVLLASGEPLAPLAAAFAASSFPTVGLAPHAWLPDGYRPGDGARFPAGVTGWNPLAKPGADFIAAFAAAEDRPAHAHAVLALEAGRLIADAAARCGGRPRGERLRAALAAATATGPRGPLRFDAETQEATTPQHCLRFATGPDGTMRAVAAEAAAEPPLLAEQVELARRRLAKQGWLNPYLFA